MGILCNTDELVAQKDELYASFTSLWDDVQACPGMTPQDKQAFQYEMESFKKWLQRGKLSPALAAVLGLPGVLMSGPICFADAELREGRDFKTKIELWRKKLTDLGCKPSAPDLPGYDPSDPRSKDHPSKASEISTTIDKINGILKTTAIIGGIGLGIYGLWLATPIIKEFASGAAALRGKK